MVLGEDMLTVERKPEFIVPSHMYGSHTDFSGHEFFEASSIRKRGEKYYFVYSSVVIGKWYVFYHRHTNNSWYCRQGCAEPVQFDGDHIVQAQMTSCGLNNGPLLGKGIYPAYIACNIFTPEDQMVLR